MSPESEAERYRGYLQEEADGVYIYRSLADIEQDETLRGVYRQLAEVEERHLALWQERLREIGVEPAAPRPSHRARILMWSARHFGAEFVLPVIKTMESDATAMYTGEAVAEAAGLPQDERQHYRVFSAIAGRRDGVAGSVIGRIEARHRSLGGGNALRAAVLGANDGLVSNLALVMGVAGADPGAGTIVLAGVAGLLAGSFSMALGEWISVTSSREAAEAQLAVEREEIALMPEAEQEELALIYRAKGLPQAEAESLAAQIMSSPDTALQTLAREELGLVPGDLGSPWTAATASLALFSVGAVIPLLPFLIGEGRSAVMWSAVLSAVALFVLGAGITLLTGRNAWYSGMRQVLLGLAAAAVTYVLGSMVGGIAGV